MKHILFIILFYLPFNLLSQTTKVKNDDIINLREQIKELKIENSLLIDKIGELNLKFSQIEKTLEDTFDAQMEEHPKAA
jgi:predicted nuclease with TOPRIM domain